MKLLVILFLLKLYARTNDFNFTSILHTFWKKPLEFLDLSLYPWKFWRKQSVTPGNSTKLY